MEQIFHQKPYMEKVNHSNKSMEDTTELTSIACNLMLTEVYDKVALLIQGGRFCKFNEI